MLSNPSTLPCLDFAILWSCSPCYSNLNLGVGINFVSCSLGPGSRVQLCSRDLHSKLAEFLQTNLLCASQSHSNNGISFLWEIPIFQHLFLPYFGTKSQNFNSSGTWSLGKIQKCKEVFWFGSDWCKFAPT